MMEKEYTSLNQMGPYPQIVIIALLSFFPLVGFCLTVAAISVSYSSYVHDGYSLLHTLLLFIFMMSVAFLCYVMGWLFIASVLAQYRFTKMGLFAKFPLQKEILIPWEDFQQVCICYAAYTTRGEPRANTVLCFVKKGEKKNWKLRWKTDNIFHYRSVLCIDYRDSLFEGLKEVFPGDIPDLRNTLAYRLW